MTRGVDSLAELAAITKSGIRQEIRWVEPAAIIKATSWRLAHARNFRVVDSKFYCQIFGAGVPMSSVRKLPNRWSRTF